MKKREIPEGTVAVETYRWDPDLENYVLVSREPVKKENGEREEGTAK